MSTKQSERGQSRETDLMRQDLMLLVIIQHAPALLAFKLVCQMSLPCPSRDRVLEVIVGLTVRTGENRYRTGVGCE